jgi:hypothetical protein
MRFVQAELGRKIGHRPRPQNAGVGGAPGAVRPADIPAAAVRVVDAAVQHQFAGAALDFASGISLSSESDCD